MTLVDAPSGTPTDDSLDGTAEADRPAEARGSGEKKGSLLPVIRVIPEEAYDNPTWRGLLYFGRDLVIYVACLVGLALTNNPLFLLPLFVLIGLTLLPALPIVLTMTERHTGVAEGTAAGLIWMTGNLGGLVVAGATGLLVDRPAAAFGLCAVATMVGVPLVLRLRREPVAVG